MENDYGLDQKVNGKSIQESMADLLERNERNVRFFSLDNSLTGRAITSYEIFAVSDLKSEGRCSRNLMYSYQWCAVSDLKSEGRCSA